ncbi:hypothetical protein D9M68_809490 [compost metagenome]
MAGTETGDLGQFGDADAPRQVLADIAVQPFQVERAEYPLGLLAEQTQVQCTQQHATERASQQWVAAIAFQFGPGVAEQVLEVRIQLRVARGLEQMGEQFQVFAGNALLVQVDDQHAVVAHAGELVICIPWHQAGAHAAHLAATSIDLELRTPSQRQHQLMVVVGVFVGLIVQTDQTGFEHCNGNSRLK